MVDWKMLLFLNCEILAQCERFFERLFSVASVIGIRHTWKILQYPWAEDEKNAFVGNLCAVVVCRQANCRFKNIIHIFHVSELGTEHLCMCELQYIAQFSVKSLDTEPISSSLNWLTSMYLKTARFLRKFIYLVFILVSLHRQFVDKNNVII